MAVFLALECLKSKIAGDRPSRYGESPPLLKVTNTGFLVVQSKKVYVQVHPHHATFPESEQKRATVQSLHRPQGATRAITKGTIADKKRTLNGFVDWCLKKVVIPMIP
ncbi:MULTISPECIES: hypothetical protein [unclassified Microcoleus]|uniref:hypothetical protein n=1 Tax=unclassified Microcoleus TaxID=2642155 RepID=UPI002FD345C0